MSGVGKTTGSVCAAATSAAFSATSVPVESATYHCRFQKRSLAAFRILSRYDFGSSVVFGYAVPFTIGVSLNCSMPTEMLGVPGINSGSQKSAVLGSQFGSKYGFAIGPCFVSVAGGQNHGPYIQRPNELMPPASPGF